MKIRNLHPCGDVTVLIPGNPPRQVDVKAGEVFEVSESEAAVLLEQPTIFEPVRSGSKEK